MNSRSIDQTDKDQVEKFILESKFIFAKTMKHSPHWYTLRKNSNSQKLFNKAVEFIREHGYEKQFGKSHYWYYDINGFQYWTMGSPVNETILINKARVKTTSVYDHAATRYDSIFVADQYRDEEADIMKMIGPLHGSVLDVGCGTGMLLEYYNPNNYTGIDPSRAMLNAFYNKHPDRLKSLHCVTAEKFVSEPFDNVICLFSGSYITDLDSLKELWNGKGRFFAMFYAKGYHPVTHKKLEILPDTTYYTLEELEDIFDKKPIHFNNYLIIIA